MTWRGPSPRLGRVLYHRKNAWSAAVPTLLDEGSPLCSSPGATPRERDSQRWTTWLFDTRGIVGSVRYQLCGMHSSEKQGYPGPGRRYPGDSWGGAGCLGDGEGSRVSNRIRVGWLWGRWVALRSALRGALRGAARVRSARLC